MNKMIIKIINIPIIFFLNYIMAFFLQFLKYEVLILTLIIKGYCIINNEAMDITQPFTINLRYVN